MGVGSPTTSAPGRWFYKQEYVQEIEKELNVSELRSHGEVRRRVNLSKGGGGKNDHNISGYREHIKSFNIPF